MTTASGIFTRHYFTPQSHFETAASPSGTDGAKLKTALTFTKSQNSEIRDDFHPGTRDLMEDVPLNIKVSMQGTAYVLGGSAQGDAPDLDDVYQTAFSRVITTGSTVAASPAPSVNQFKLASDNLDVGQLGKIDVTNADGDVIEKRYFTVLSKNESDVLTIWPALDHAPMGGDVVKAVVNYGLTLFNSNAVTCHRSDNLVGEMGIGGKFHKFLWKFAMGQTGELIIDGQCRDLIRSIFTTLDEIGGIDDSQTEFSVATDGNEVGAVLACEDERMLVTGVSEDGLTLTVQRGYDDTTPAAHDDQTQIGPCQPESSTVGSPVRGLFGGIWLDSDSRFIKADEISISIDEKTRYVGFFGDEGKAKAVVNADNREIVWEMLCHLDETTASKVRKATANSALKAFCQAGKDDGRGCAFYSPKVQFDTPEIPDSRGDLVRVTLKSRAVLGSSGEDAVSFGF